MDPPDELSSQIQLYLEERQEDQEIHHERLALKQSSECALLADLIYLLSLNYDLSSVLCTHPELLKIVQHTSLPFPALSAHINYFERILQRDIQE